MPVVDVVVVVVVVVEPGPVIVPAAPVSSVVSTDSVANVAEENANNRRPTMLKKLTEKVFMAILPVSS